MISRIGLFVQILPKEDLIRNSLRESFAMTLGPDITGKTLAVQAWRISEKLLRGIPEVPVLRFGGSHSVIFLWDYPKTLR